MISLRIIVVTCYFLFYFSKRLKCSFRANCYLYFKYIFRSNCYLRFNTSLYFVCWIISKSVLDKYECVRHYLVTQPRLQIKSKAAKLLINTYFEPWKGTRDYQHCNFFIRDADRQEIKSFLMQMKPPSQLYRAGKLPVQVLRETTAQSTTCYNSNCCHGKQRYD